MRKISLSLILSLSILATYADSVSPQEAQQTASRFFATRGKALAATNISAYSIIGNVEEEYAPYYIFNAAEGNGFVVIAGNTLTEPILAYSDTGTLNEEDLPDNVRALLQAYGDEISWVAANESAVTAARASAVQTYATAARHAIAPMLTCLWGQGDPFNALCPTYTSSGATYVSSVGCTATALAQVMYYYKYPAATVGEIPAYDSYALPAVPAGTTLDWDNMLDSYEGEYNDAQKQAVAELSLYIGQAVKMKYGASSSAYISSAKTMFEDYFGYDEGVVEATASYYSIDEWFTLIYEEIAAGYPVVFTGYPSQSGGGHTFVLDGFDGDAFFHVNWGWSGGSNGYFRLTALNSGDDSCSDLSGAATGYTRDQSALLHVRCKGETVTSSVSRDFNISVSSVGGSAISGTFRNISGTAGSFEVGAVMLNDEGEYVSVGDITTFENISSGIGRLYSLTLSKCFSAPGEYKLSVAGRRQGEEQWTPTWTLTADDYILATVDDNLSMTLSLHLEGLSAIDWDYTGYLVINQEQHVIVTFANTGEEFNDLITLYAYRPGDTSRGSVRSRANVGVKMGSESKVDFFFTLDTVGEWVLELVNSSRTIGLDTIEIVSAKDVTTATLAVSAVNISNDCYGSRLAGTVTIKNNGDEPFTGQVRVSLYHRLPSGSATEPASSIISVSELAAGRTASLAFDFGNLTIGGAYDIVVRDYATDADGSVTNGDLSWDWPYVLKAGILQWSNDGTIAGSAAKDALTPTTSVAGVFCEGVSPDVITPSRNTNTIYAFTAGTAIPAGVEGYNVVYGSQAEQITFANNGYAAYLPLTFTAHEAVYRHTFATTTDGVTGWEALTLPFKPDGVRCEGADIAWKHGADDEDGVFYLREFAYEDDSQTVVFDDVEDISSLWANAPYVIAATPEMEGKTVEFYAAEARLSETGTVPYIACTDDYYFYGTTLRVRDSGLYVLNNEGYAYEYKSGTASVSPFENYFITTLPEDERPEMIYISTEAATGIRSVESAATQKDGAYYDLQGRRITSPTKGVYILNGKKYVK